jgi:hypothetical protein
MNKITLMVILLFLYSYKLIAGTIDPNTPDQKYIDYGSKFPHIAQISGISDDNEPYFASGVAYRDNIIITAAHVLSATKDQIIKVNINNKNLTTDTVIIHQKYNSNSFGYYDIGIIKLKDSIGLDWYPELYQQEDEHGKICSLSGFGITGTFNTGAIKSDRFKRAGSNTIDGIDRGMLVCTPSINIRKTELEFIIAPGDSGGGLFIGNKLAGIHSCIMANGHKAKSDYKTESGHTRISNHVEWINSTVEFLQHTELRNEKK